MANGEVPGSALFLNISWQHNSVLEFLPASALYRNDSLNIEGIIKRRIIIISSLRSRKNNTLANLQHIISNKNDNIETAIVGLRRQGDLEPPPPGTIPMYMVIVIHN